MKIYDVTLPLQPNMPTFDNNEPGPTLDYRGLMSRGDPYNISSLHLGSHTGTHVDAPHHFIDGAPTIEQLPLDALLGPAQIIEHAEQRHITAADLDAASLSATTQRLLLKTPNARFLAGSSFHRDFVALTPDAARWIVDRGILLVGIDYMSIEPYDTTDYAVHITLLERNVIIIEGLDLRRVDSGEYNMVCAPLPVAGAEGAPARVLLWND